MKHNKVSQTKHYSKLYINKIFNLTAPPELKHSLHMKDDWSKHYFAAPEESYRLSVFSIWKYKVQAGQTTSPLFAAAC